MQAVVAEPGHVKLGAVGDIPIQPTRCRAWSYWSGVASRQCIEYGQQWISERPGLRPRTVDLYRWLFGKYIASRLGRCRLGDLDASTIRTWRQELIAAGVSETMAAKAYRLLRAILMTAVDDGLIARNPCRIKGGGTESPAERPTLTVDQVLQLADRMPKRFRALVLLATFASLRWGEVTALRRCDLERDGGLVKVRATFVERSTGPLVVGLPKSRAGRRTVAVPGPIAAVLREHVAEFAGPGSAALVFTGVKGAPLRRSNFNTAVGWTAAVAAIGAPGLHFHDLRHTGNVLAARTPGASLRDLMERMGHDSMRAALIYQHVHREADRQIAEALSEQLVAAQTEVTAQSQTARRQHETDEDDNAVILAEPRKAAPRQ